MAGSPLWWLPAVAILLGGLTSLWAQLYVFPSEVDPEEWKEPATYVLEHIRQGDRVWVAPAWNEDPLPYLESVGDQIIPQKQPLAEDIQSARRIWVLSETPRLDEALETLPYSPSRPKKKSFGDVTVVRTTVPSNVQFDYVFHKHLDEAIVERIDGESAEQCKNWSGRDRRWDCGSRDKWMYVGQRFLTLANDPHTCIWAHPLDGNRTLRITFPDVPLGQLLRIRAGLTGDAATTQNSGPVHLTINVAGETRVTHTYPARETTWFPHDIATTDLTGKKRDVVLEIRAPKIKNRWFCLNGWVD